MSNAGLNLLLSSLQTRYGTAACDEHRAALEAALPELMACHSLEEVSERVFNALWATFDCGECEKVYARMTGIIQQPATEGETD